MEYVDVHKEARRDADVILIYTMLAPIASDEPLRRRILERMETVTAQFPGPASKKLVSTMYLNAFFDRVRRVLAGGFESFWYYISRTRDEIAPLFITYMLITYVLALMGASYVFGIAPELAIVSAIIYPTALVFLMFTAYLLYLYYGYSMWVRHARALFSGMLAEWKKEGKISPPKEQPYVL